MLVAEGLTDRQIAARLFISERTVHAHLRAAYAKTGTGSRTRLTAWLARQAQASRELPHESTHRVSRGHGARSRCTPVSVTPSNAPFRG
jgi:hypothetical protein